MTSLCGLYHSFKHPTSGCEPFKITNKCSQSHVTNNLQMYRTSNTTSVPKPSVVDKQCCTSYTMDQHNQTLYKIRVGLPVLGMVGVEELLGSKKGFPDVDDIPHNCVITFSQVV